jgi:hypothetical protein
MAMEKPGQQHHEPQTGQCRDQAAQTLGNMRVEEDLDIAVSASRQTLR